MRKITIILFASIFCVSAFAFDNKNSNNSLYLFVQNKQESKEKSTDEMKKEVMSLFSNIANVYKSMKPTDEESKRALLGLAEKFSQASESFNEIISQGDVDIKAVYDSNKQYFDFYNVIKQSEGLSVSMKELLKILENAAKISGIMT